MTNAARICAQGHVVTAYAALPEGYTLEALERDAAAAPDDKPCPECGNAVIMQCPACHAFIPGDNFQDGGKEFRFLDHCAGCGKPFPWAKEGADKTVPSQPVSLEPRAGEVEHAMKICSKGHVADPRFRVVDSAGMDALEHAAAGRSSEEFCEGCGSAVIMNCPSCDAPIPARRGARMPSSELGEIPAYCKRCGDAYPWMKSALEEWKTSVDALDIPEAHKAELASVVDDIAEPRKLEAALRRYAKLKAEYAPKFSETFATLSKILGLINSVKGLWPL